MNSADSHEAGLELLRKSETLIVLRALTAAGVEPLVFKGTALAYSIYSAAHERPRWDTDLLLPKEQAEVCHRVLVGLGYSLYPQLEVFHEICFVKVDLFGLQHVWDIHFKISNRADLAELFSYQELLERAVDVPTLETRRPGDVDHILLTVVHVLGHHAEWDAHSLEDVRRLYARLDEAGRTELWLLADAKGLRLEVEAALTARPTPARYPLGYFVHDWLQQVGWRAKWQFLRRWIWPNDEYCEFHGVKPWQRIARRLPFVGLYSRYAPLFGRYSRDFAPMLSALALLTTVLEGMGLMAVVGYLRVSQRPTAFLVAAALLFVLRGAILFWSRRMHYRLHVELQTRLTSEVSSALERLPLHRALEGPAVSFAHLVTQEIPRAVSAFYQLSLVAPLLLALVTYISLAWSQQAAITLSALSLALLLSGGAAWSRRQMQRAAASLSQAEVRAGSLLVQMMQAFRYLRATAGFAPVRQGVERESGAMAQAASVLGTHVALLPALAETLLVLWACAVLGLHLHWGGTSIEGPLVSVILLYRGLREFLALQSVWQGFVQNAPAMDRVQEFLSSSAGEENLTGVELAAGPMHVEWEDLTFAHGGPMILESFSFNLQPGASLALSGPSGSGKSTMLDLVTGLLTPQRGEVRINGVPLIQLNMEKFRSRVGYVAQDPVVFDGSVADNVSLWRGADERVRRALDTVSLDLPLDWPVGERGCRLSGGQRQRLALARELYKNISLLILDEATSALDLESERAIAKALRQLHGRVTVIAVAHRSAVLEFCDVQLSSNDFVRRLEKHTASVDDQLGVLTNHVVIEDVVIGGDQHTLELT